MNLAETGKLLAIVASFDNRKLDEAVAHQWRGMLAIQLHGRDSLPVAVEVVYDWFAVSGRPYFMVGDLVDGMRKKLRLTPRDIEADVRVAKSRGLLGTSHDPRVPVPVDVAVRLAAARADAQAAAPELEAVVDRSTIALDVGRRQ